MKKLLIVITFITLLSSCTTQKEVMDSWLGKSKQSLYLSWGPPERTTDDGAGGEILVYLKNVYMPANQTTYTMNKMFYVNKDGVVYHWSTRNDPIAPTRVNVKLVN